MPLSQFKPPATTPTRAAAFKNLVARFSVAAKGQWVLFRKEPLRYIFSEVLPLPGGGTIYDILSGRSIYAEMFDPKRGSILDAYKQHVALQQKHGLETQPFLLRAFTRSYRQGAREFQKLPPAEQKEAFAQKAESLGRYLNELKAMNVKAKLAARLARAKTIPTQRVLAQEERRKPVESFNLKPRAAFKPLVLLQRVLASRILARRPLRAAVEAENRFSTHFDVVSRVKIPSRPPSRLFLRRAA